MSKLEKLPIFFVTIETLVNMYKQNEDMRFENWSGNINSYKEF